MYMSTSAEKSASETAFRWSGWPLVLLLALSLGLRLYGLGERSYFNDELSAIFRTQADTFGEFVEEAVIPDYHPAGIQWILWKLTGYLGTDPLVVRLPFALAGTLGVWVLFLLGKIWFGEKTAWMAASALACLQFPVYFSQLARPYSTGALFVLMAALFFTLLTRSGDKRLWKRFVLATAAGISCALCMYNHYFSFFVAGFMALGFFPMQRKKTIVPYLFAGAIALILFIPHFEISRIQLSRGGLSSWLPPPKPVWLKEHLLYLFNESKALTCLFALFLVPLIIRLTGRPVAGLKRGKVYLAAGIYLGSLGFAWLYSVLVNPILQNSIMLFAFPFLLLAIFFGAGVISDKWFRIIGVLFPLILTTHLIFAARYYRFDQYSDFRTNAALICDVISNHEDAVWIAQVNDPWYLHFYMDPVCKPDSALTYLITDREGLKELDQSLDTLKADHAAFVWLRPYDPMITSVIRSHFPYLVKYNATRSFDEFYHFSQINAAVNQNGYPFDTLLLASSRERGNPLYILPEKEFSELFNGSLPTAKIPASHPCLLHASLTGIGDTTLSALQLVVSLESNTGVVKSWNSLPASFLDPKGTRFFYSVHLPAYLKKTDRLKVFLWNPDQETYTLKQYTISLILPQALK